MERVTPLINLHRDFYLRQSNESMQVHRKKSRLMFIHTLTGLLVLVVSRDGPAFLHLFIRIFTTSNLSNWMATSTGFSRPFGGSLLALWSNKTLIKSVRSLKSQWMTSSKGTLLASQPVPRPPEPFWKRFSPPPPMKRRWSRSQSLSSTVSVITVWSRFRGTP